MDGSPWPSRRGLDSTVVAKAAQLACGENAIALTSVSPALASGEKEQAEELATLIGISHRCVETGEFDNADYLKNSFDRCYFCKGELYTKLQQICSELGFDVIVNGANVDDQGDYRPGMNAAEEYSVRSPLIEAGLTKADVRELARHWELPIWDKPAAPCLASRIAYGVEVTPERVRRVDEAEQFLRSEFGIRELRVRHEANELARIEVPATEIPRLVADGANRQIAEFLHSIGFKYVALDLDGFRSGSLNAVVPTERSSDIRRVRAAQQPYEQSCSVLMRPQNARIPTSEVSVDRRLDRYEHHFR